MMERLPFEAPEFLSFWMWDVERRDGAPVPVRAKRAVGQNPDEAQLRDPSRSKAIFG
jgi:hypothetical protein